MKNQSNHFGSKRKIIDTNTAKFDVYDFGGPALKGVHQLDLSYDRETGHDDSLPLLIEWKRESRVRQPIPNHTASALHPP